MALRDQPYIPLYIQDFLTDEKLIECSAESTGVYIRLMCLMHKNEEYGKILLKQKDKQTDNQIKNFALKLIKYLPYTLDVIVNSLEELVRERVLTISNDELCQKRMIKDNELSIKRSESGKKGGNPALLSPDISLTKNKKRGKPKLQANSENESEYKDDIDLNNNTPSEKNENFIKFQKWIDKNAPRVNKMKEPFTESEFENLKNDFTLKDIQELLKAMHNHKPLLEKNLNANLTFRNWIKRRTTNTITNEKEYILPV